METVSSYNIFVLKSDKKRPLERPRYKWKGNIKTDLKEKSRTMWTGFRSLGIMYSGGI
jgi:hypothetical protein